LNSFLFVCVCMVGRRGKTLDMSDVSGGNLLMMAHVGECVVMNKVFARVWAALDNYMPECHRW